MKSTDINSISQDKFRFAQADKKIGDKKLETKPIGFFRDAWRRFAKNKSSIVGMVIVILLLLFSIIVPITSRYSVSYADGIYKNCLPKISANASGGFWDGTSKQQRNAAAYWQYYAMGLENDNGRGAVVKTYGITTSREELASGTIETVLYSFRLDSYNAVGYKFVELTEAKYLALQNYQNETGIQVIYPMLVKSKIYGSTNNTYGDPNYWYETNLKGNNKAEPVWEGGEEGNFKPIYETGGFDDYNSLRIKGDPALGTEDPNTVRDRYSYAAYTEGGYLVRVLYYDYYVYLNGFEPVFVLGANASGQDLMVCLASGTRFSFMLGFGVAIINLILGAIYGSIEGFYGGKIDLIMERISDILSGIPFMVMAVLFNMHLAKSVGAVGSLLFAFMLTGWISTAGTVRMQFYRFKKHEYVLAAKTLGARDRRLILKHIFPNALGTIITGAALAIPSVIFSETSLTYLGIISLDNPATGLTSLGTLLSAGQAAISTYPHILLFPSLVIALLMISFNLFGNGLRDAFNPSLRGSEG